MFVGLFRCFTLRPTRFHWEAAVHIYVWSFWWDILVFDMDSKRFDSTGFCAITFNELKESRLIPKPQPARVVPDPTLGSARTCSNTSGDTSGTW